MKISSRFYIYLIAFLSVFAVQSNAQNFVQLSDASGDPSINDYLSQLQDAADSLVSVFPSPYDTQFKVYDFGFYLHQEDYDGWGYPEEFEKVVETIASPYYLVFGRQTDENGMNSKVWVDLKFDTEQFSCLEETLIASELSHFIEGKINQSNSSLMSYSLELETLNFAIQIIDEGICCSYFEGSGRTMNLPRSGGSCSFDPDKVDAALSAYMSLPLPAFWKELQYIFEWYEQCSSSEWKAFHENGIVPHCLWEGMAVPSLSYYSPIDIPYLSGLVDGTYVIGNGLYELVFSIDDLAQGLGKFSYQMTMGYYICGSDPRLENPVTAADSLQLNVIEYRYMLKLLYENPSLWPDISYHTAFKTYYESENPFIAIKNVMGVEFSADCSEVHELQNTLRTIGIALKQKETYINAWNALVNYADSTWQLVDTFSNEARYYQGYYGVQVAEVFIGFSKIKFLKTPWPYLSGFVQQVLSQANGGFTKLLSKAMSSSVLQKIIQKKSWFKDLTHTQKGNFVSDFGEDAVLLLWFTAKRAKAWKKLFKEGNVVSDLLRKDIPTLEWFSKHGDNIPQSAADDLISLIDKPIKETLEDAQGRLTYVLDRPGQSNKVVSVHPTSSGQFKTTTYSPAYNPDLNPSIDVPLSQNKLVPDYAGTSYMHPDNQGITIRIELSGNRNTDFNRARAKMKEELGLDPSDVIDETDHTWHHFDDFEVIDGKAYSTMQLVQSSAHQGTGVFGMQHSGSAAQWRAFFGSGY